MSLEPPRLKESNSEPQDPTPGPLRIRPFRLFLFVFFAISLVLLASRVSGISPYNWVQKFLKPTGDSSGGHSILRFKGKELDLFSYLETVKVYMTREGTTARLADGPEGWRESHAIIFLYELTPLKSEQVFAGFAMKVKSEVIIDLAGFRTLKIRFSPHAAGPMPDRIKLDIKSDGRTLRNMTIKDLDKNEGLIEVPLRFAASLPLSDISFTVKLEFVSRAEGGRGGFKVDSVTLDE